MTFYLPFGQILPVMNGMHAFSEEIIKDNSLAYFKKNIGHHLGFIRRFI